LVSGVIDTAHQWSAVSFTSLTTKSAHFKVEFLGEYKSIFKKTLTLGSVSLEDLFDEQNQRANIS
jgi:hypothetical protein